MTDLATNAPPLAHHGHTTALAPTEAGRDQAWASEPTQLLSDGAVSACTGSRTRSRASDTRSDPEPTTEHGTFTLTGTGIPWVHSRRHTPSAPMISITSRPLTCSRAQTPAYTGPHSRAANASAAGHGTRHGDNRHRGGTRSDSSHDMTDVSRPWNRDRHRRERQHYQADRYHANHVLDAAASYAVSDASALSADGERTHRGTREARVDDPRERSRVPKQLRRRTLIRSFIRDCVFRNSRSSKRPANRVHRHTGGNPHPPDAPLTRQQPTILPPPLQYSHHPSHPTATQTANCTLYSFLMPLDPSAHA